MKKYTFHTKPRKPLKRSPLSRGTKRMKRGKLRIAGHSTTAQLKREIQALVRLIVCYRDGGCILRNLRKCGGVAEIVNGDLIKSPVVIQADHLISRANSATFADTRLIVCLCSGCHMWKKYHEKEYEKMVRATLPSATKRLWDEAEKFRQAHKTYKPDWNMEIINLKRELSEYLPAGSRMG